MAAAVETDAPAATDTGRTLKALVADDHVLFRRGFKLLLSSIFGTSELVGASDADEAWSYLEADDGFDIVFLDLAMPGMNGVQGIRRFVDRQPKVSVVMLSAYAEPADVITCISLGARGYIPKSTSEEVLRHAVSLVLAGEIFVPATAVDHIQVEADDEFARELEKLPGNNPLRQLTGRQRETLSLMTEGLSNKEIARQMGLLESTVKAHVKVILRKLSAQNRTQAALVATDLGWPRRLRARVN